MPENDFEKKVQDKMDGFNLNPSADLWNKVEARIRKDKKRNFIFWWPLALLLLGGGTGLAIWLTKNNSSDISAPVSENKSVNLKTNISPDENAKTEKSIKDPVESILKGEENNMSLKNESQPDNKPTKNEKSPGILKSKQVLTKKPGINKQSALAETKVITKERMEQPEPNKELTEEKKGLPELNKQHVEAMKELPGQDKQLTEEKKFNEPLKDTVSEKIGKNKPMEENKKVKIQKAKRWGLGLSAGASAIVDPLSLGSTRDAMFANSGSPQQFVNYRSRRTEQSFSFSAQSFWKHRLSPRLDLVGAIGYQYLSTSRQIGERVDSARLINNYYSPNVAVSTFYRQPGSGNTGNYTNQFHFITLSGELSWRFTGEKANIRWNNGLSYDRLIGSSFLHYDGTIQGYYKDNKRLTKNHIFFNTALSIPIGKKFQLQPFASNSITSVFNTKDSTASKFSNFGLRVRYLFDKRK